MKRVRRFLRLPWADRKLLVATVIALAAIGMGLTVMGMPRVYRLLAKRINALQSGPLDRSLTARVGWSVTTAARYVPGATCLTRALAAQLLLAWRGHPACVRIGVKLTEGDFLEGHAWLEADGAVLIGNSPELQSYVLLPL